MLGSGLVDEIYEAAVIPGKWIPVLDSMAQIAGGEGTVLFATSPSGPQMLRSPAIAEVLDLWVSSGWADRNERLKRLSAIDEPRFKTELDGFSLDELDHIPYYRDFLRPIGFGWCVGTEIYSPSKEMIMFSVERLYKKGPVEQHAIKVLDCLRPHLARAAFLSASIGLERARAQILALETIGLPAAVLGRTGKVLAANDLVASCAPALRIGAGDSLVFHDSATQELYASSLQAYRSGRLDLAAGSLAIRGTEVNAPAVAHIIPLRREACEIFSGAQFLIYLTRLSDNAVVPQPILKALFDLTSAEARVAEMVVAGSTATEVATQLSISVHTIRQHIKVIFSKTGVRRQADLIRLLTIPASSIRNRLPE